MSDNVNNNTASSNAVASKQSEITLTKEGYARSFVGREAVEVFRLRTLIQGLKLEEHGIKVRRGLSCLKIAKAETGLRTNNRQAHIATIQTRIEELLDKVAITTEG